MEFEPVILTPFKAYFNGVYYMEKKNYIKVFGVVAIILAVFALFLYAICYVCVEYRDNRSSLSSDIGQESVTPTADIEWGPAAYDVEYELGETTAAAMRSKWNTYVNSSSEDNVVKIKLTADWVAVLDSSGTNIPYIAGSSSAHKYVVLDLNGHKITRSSGTGRLIYASYADFTIEDSSGGQGVITNGYTNNSLHGSALYATNCNITLNGINISYCRSYGSTTKRGTGPVYVEGESNFTMNGGSIYSNNQSDAYVDSNGLNVYTYLDGGYIVLNGVTFSNNICTSKRNITCNSLTATRGTVTVTDCTFTGNNGQDGYFYNLLSPSAGKAVNIKGCNFYNNKGLSIYIDGAPTDGATIENCEIYNNTSTYSQVASCVYDGVSTSTLIQDCNIHDNTGQWGAIQQEVNRSSLSLVRTSITNNTAIYTAAGIYIRNRGSICNIIDSTITGNKATNSSYGAIELVVGTTTYTGSLTLSGLVKITGNTNKADEQADLTLFPKIVGELDEESEIGIFVGVTIATGTAVTTGYSTYNAGIDPSNIFFSNNPRYVVAWNTAGTEAAFVTPKTMDKPTADETNFVYTGAAQTYNPQGIDTAYMKVDNNVQVNAGTYTVTVTPINGCVWTGYSKDPVTFDFVINKATPKITPSKTSITVAETAEGCEYDISGVASNGENVKIAYYDSGGALLAGPPTAQGIYRIVLSVAATDNYNAASVTVPLTITQHKHTFDNYVFNDGTATCTQDGTETGQCTFPNCSETDTRSKEGTALGHDYVGEPTWVWGNSYHTATATFVCSRGDDPDYTIAAQVTENREEATCSKEGLLTLTASVTLNGKTYTDVKTDVITTLPHDYSITRWEWAEDYSSATFYYECAECGDSGSVTVDSVIKIDKQPTCTEFGSKTYTVTATYPYAKTATDSQTVSIDKIDHDYSSQVFAPSCTVDGYTLHICSQCGDTYQDDIQSALGHTYDSYGHDGDTHWQICSTCGHTSAPTSHTYSYSSTIKDATETEQGEELWECECGSQITKTTPTLAHTQHTPGDVWMSDGTYHWHECTFDGCNEQLDKVEHDYQDTVIAPTCTTDGYTLHTCDVCKESHRDT